MEETFNMHQYTDLIAKIKPASLLLLAFVFLPVQSFAAVSEYD